MIDILVPVRERPENVVPLLMSIKESTRVPYRVIFIVHVSDKAEMSAVSRAGATILRSDNHEYAKKINLACATLGPTILTKAEFFFLGADDLLFHRGWDRAAIKCFHATGKPVIGTNDLGNPAVMAGRHATHALVHRSYLEQGTIDEPGKLLHDGYVHNWVDTEFTETALKRDCFAFAADSKVEHNHPFWGKGVDDRIYEIGRKSYHLDRRLFQKRRRLWR